MSNKVRFLQGTRPLVALAAAGSLVGLTAVANSQGMSNSNDNGATVYEANLTALPNTRGSGKAVLKLSANGKNLQVRITATGLDAGGPHLSHVHGLLGGADSTCPTSAQDSDRDGFVELAEGAVKYGPIILDFMNIDPDQDGNIDFQTNMKLSGDSSDALPLVNRHIVIHGMRVGAVGAGTPGEVNGTADYKVLLPVLCGEIMQAGRGRNAMDFVTPRK
jgi:type 1 fimbria pilin